MPLEMMHISLALKDSASFRQALLLDAGGIVASRKGTKHRSKGTKNGSKGTKNGSKGTKISIMTPPGFICRSRLQRGAIQRGICNMRKLRCNAVPLRRLGCTAQRAEAPLLFSAMDGPWALRSCSILYSESTREPLRSSTALQTRPSSSTPRAPRLATLRSARLSVCLFVCSDGRRAHARVNLEPDGPEVRRTRCVWAWACRTRPHLPDASDASETFLPCAPKFPLPARRYTLAFCAGPDALDELDGWVHPQQQQGVAQAPPPPSSHAHTHTRTHTHPVPPVRSHHSDVRYRRVRPSSLPPVRHPSG